MLSFNILFLLEVSTVLLNSGEGDRGLTEVVICLVFLQVYVLYTSAEILQVISADS